MSAIEPVLPQSAPGGTDLNDAEIGLRDAKNLNRAILDAVNTQIAVIDRTGTIIEVNEPWRRFAVANSLVPGQPASHTDIGVNYLDICRRASGISSEGAQAVADGIQSVLDGTTRLFRYNYPCHGPGEDRWFTMSVTPLGHSQGGAVISHIDITSPILLAEKLRESEESFRLLFENAPIGIAMADQSRRFFKVNKAFCDMLGYDESELTQMTFTDVTHPDDIDPDMILFKHAYENRIPSYRMRKRYAHRNGEVIWVNLFSTLIRSPTGAPLYSVGLVENITDRVNAERERQAHEASQRAALVREVHHRIKNNLHGVVALLRGDIARYPEATLAIEAAIAQVNTISVVYGLQSRLSENELRPAELVREIVKAAASLAMVPAPSVVDHQAGALMFNRNATVALALILNELVQNAIKHGQQDHGLGVEVALSGDADTLSIRIDNPGRPLPPGFDLETGVACGIGLDLVRTLLPRKGARLTMAYDGLRVRTELTLTPPHIIGIPDQHAHEGSP